MANANDALGLAAERIMLNAKQTAIGTAIAAWKGDANGLRDLQTIQAQIHDRLNLPIQVGTAYSSFGMGAVST